MQIEHLRCLLAVAECGSMNKAAKKLFCTQPTISNAIRNLEEDLGCKLVERTDRGVVPTEFGNTVLEDVRLILDYIDRWKIAADHANAAKEVTISISGSAPRHGLIDFVMKFKEKHPQIIVNFTDLAPVKANAGRFPYASDTPSRIMLSYRVPMHLSDAKQYSADRGLHLASLQKDEFRLFLNSRNPLAQKKEDIVLEDLRGTTALLFQNPKGFPYIDKLQSVNCKIGSQLWSEENLMMLLALSADAISFRPRRTTEHNPYIVDQIVTSRQVVDCPMPVHLCIFYPASSRMTDSEKIFIDELKAYFPEYELLV